ncbi:MAG TPA: CaiB/BaiF CoA-transferase family protein [Bacteroidia bacterium]|nr:CaiB/BaiF CoA-transferase family protein [Bacteroidia bacterium]
MHKPFSDLKVIELAGVLAGPSAGLFFAELGATVIKIENPKTGGDVTRSWKLKSEDKTDKTSAYFWSVNAGKEILFLDLSIDKDLQSFYELIKTADVLITNYKLGDDLKLKVDYNTLKQLNPTLIYASINGFGNSSPRTAYDLILQAESGFMFMNGEKNAVPLKMPVALIDILAGHQLKEAILIALLDKHKNNKGSHITVSLFDTAVASLANQATNWLIAHHLPTAQGSLHPNIAPYGEIFTTKDNHQITFAIGSDKQFKHLCEILNLDLFSHIEFENNQLRVANRSDLFSKLNDRIQTQNFDKLFSECIKNDVPIGKIRNLKEVFELPEAKAMLNSLSKTQSVQSISFKFEE